MVGHGLLGTRWFPLAAGLTYLAFDYVGNSVTASLSGAPSSDDPVLSAFLADHATVIDLMALLTAVSGICLAAFAVALRRRLPSATAGDIVAGSGIAFATAGALQSVIWWTATGDHPEGRGRALWELLLLSSVLSTVPAGVIVLVTSVTVRRHRSGPAWVWRSGFALALLVAVPFAAWVTLKLFPVWVVAAGISLLRRGDWAVAVAGTRVAARPEPDGVGRRARP